MRKIVLLILVCSFTQFANSQRLFRFDDSGKTSTKVFDLVHTKLKLDFDFEDQTVNGEAWITLTPHSKANNKLSLDAKAMNIAKVEVLGEAAEYYNTGTQLNIDLGKTYKVQDTVTVYVKYKAIPNDVIQEKGSAVTDNKGIYFIDPYGTDPNKPTQIWTQGEPESNRVWFPTLDKPNQKTTQEMYLTVPAKFKTLSNGKLVSQTENANGTRTDYWKQTLPHAPYLFFVGVGDFEVVKNEWRGKEVSYYIEPGYGETAKELFKNTNGMLDYFSDITGIEYPWDKYSQTIVRDFISGAMENTTAVVHHENAIQSKGQLAEQNEWESTIAHEMFHHWFGDLVTTESWANITVNESFANYSEFLWLNHHYGKDKADEHLKKSRDGYFGDTESYDKDLVRYKHNVPDDVFDVVSYNKGGLILHMLKDYLGEDIFFKGLNTYLNQHKFKTGEAHQLRLAFEQVSGEDLMWFFSQWYYNNGHPKLKVSYDKNVLEDKLIVTVTQKEKEFDFPLMIDVYEKGKLNRQRVFITDQQQKFEFSYKHKPELVIVNGNKVLLAEIETPKKSTKEWIKQYEYSKQFDDQLQALDTLKALQDDKDVFEVFSTAINDDYETLQVFAIKNINLGGKYAKKSTIKALKKLTNSDQLLVQAAALETLGKLINIEFLPLFEEKLSSISPSVKGSALMGIYYIDKEKAIKYANELPDDTKKYISLPLLKIYLKEKNVKNQPFIAKHLLSGMFFTADEEFRETFKESFDWMATTNNTEAIKNLVDDFVVKGNRYRKYQFNYTCITLLRKLKDKQIELKQSNMAKHLALIEQGIIDLAD